MRNSNVYAIFRLLFYFHSKSSVIVCFFWVRNSAEFWHNLERNFLSLGNILPNSFNFNRFARIQQTLNLNKTMKNLPQSRSATAALTVTAYCPHMREDSHTSSDLVTVFVGKTNLSIAPYSKVYTLRLFVNSPPHLKYWKISVYTSLRIFTVFFFSNIFAIFWNWNREEIRWRILQKRKFGLKENSHQK